MTAMIFLFGIVIYLNSAFPKVGPAKELTINQDSLTIEHGKYLANHVAVCMDCHSTRDWSTFAGPIVAGTEGKGGELFDENFGFPGTFYSRNLTPHNLKNWTNGEIYRAFTSGVNKSGNALFPVMPYQSYGHMDINDAKAIIAYLRTLQPIDNQIPPSKASFPMNLILRTIPGEASPQTRPSPDDKNKYGEYLVKISGCADCHTPMNKGVPVFNKKFAGGMEFTMPKVGTVRSANLTPDERTGLGAWTEDGFVQRFKMYEKPENRNIKVNSGEIQTVMPWTMYSGMKESDLRAIYSFLRTLKPMDNQVTKFTSAK